MERTRPGVDPAPRCVERVGVVLGLLRRNPPGPGARPCRRSCRSPAGGSCARGGDGRRRLLAAQRDEVLEHPQAVARGLLGVELDAEHGAVLDDRRETLAVLGRSRRRRPRPPAARPANERGRRDSPPSGSPAAAASGARTGPRSSRCAGPAGRRCPAACTSPGISPSPACASSSSESSNSSCIPRQMPSSGRAVRDALADQLGQPELVEIAHRGRECPHSGDDEPVGSTQLVVVARDRSPRAPTCSSAFCTERRLPIP